MIEQLFRLVINLSLQASAIGLLIYAVKILLGKRLTLQFKYYIWLLVFIKLVLPISVESSFSLFNHIRINQNPMLEAVLMQSQNESDMTYDKVEQSISPLMPEGIQTGNALNWYGMLSYLWISVAVASLIYLLWNYLNIKIYIYKKQSDGISQKYEEIISLCFSEIGVPVSTEVVFTSYVKAPFVFGFFKPLIVLPSDLLNIVSNEEFMAIISHEAMHIKLNHHKIKMLTYASAIIHWFNPLVWIFLKSMQADAEFYCDYAVITKTNSTPKEHYLNALLKIAKLGQTDFVPALNFGRSHLRRRVERIMKINPISKYTVALSILLTVMLSVACLTSATAKAADSNDSIEASLSSNSYKGKSIDSIKINIDAAKLVFEKSKSDEITISLMEADVYSKYYILTTEIVEENELNISLNRLNDLGANLQFLNSAQLVISLPEKDFTKLDISLNASKAVIDSFNVGELILTANASKLELLNNSFEKLDITDNACNIDIALKKGMNDINLNIESNVGKVELPADWKYEKERRIVSANYKYLAGNGKSIISIKSNAGNLTIKN